MHTYTKGGTTSPAPPRPATSCRPRLGVDGPALPSSIGFFVSTVTIEGEDRGWAASGAYIEARPEAPTRPTPSDPRKAYASFSP